MGSLAGIMVVVVSVQMMAAPDNAVDVRLFECAGVVPPEARLRCFDALAQERLSATSDTTGDVTHEPSATERAERVGAGTDDATPATATGGAAAPIGLDETQSADDFGAASLRQPAERRHGEIEAIETAIVRLEERPYGHRVFHLDNGQVWTEVQPGRVRYRRGDLVRIERAVLGSFMLSVEGRRASRVRRVE